MSRCYACNDALPIKPEECWDPQTGRYYCPHCWEKEINPGLKTEVQVSLEVILSEEELDEESISKPISDYDLQSQLLGCCHFPGESHTRQLVPNGDTVQVGSPFDPFYDVDEFEDT